MTEQELAAIRERSNWPHSRSHYTLYGEMGEDFGALLAEVDRLLTENAMLLHDVGTDGRRIHAYRMSQLAKLRHAEAG